MDQNPGVFDENLKKEVEKFLVEKIITALEAKQINIAQMKESSAYILDNIVPVKNYSDFILFLEKLKSKWSIFTEVFGLYKNKFYKDKEKVMINRLSQYITSQKQN